MMALWLVRAGRHGERESLAQDKGLSIIGWEDLPDLSSIQNREELEKLLDQTYPEKKRKALLNWQSQIWPFLREMQRGDLVAMPLKTRSAIAFGEVAGSYEYRTNLPENSRHVRPVRWYAEVSRSSISQDLLYSMGALMTVCRIQRNDAEQRIRRLLAGEAPSPSPTEDGTDADTNGNEALDIEEHAMDQIREHIGRTFKGHGLARLVGAVLEAQGYKVQVSPEGADGGVDIIAGHGPLGFDQPRLIAQVKSGETPVDVKIVRELQGVMKSFGAEHGLVVSWGGFRSSVPRETGRLYFELRLWNADDLIRAVLASYEKLSDSLQAELPLKRIWVLVPTEEEES